MKRHLTISSVAAKSVLALTLVSSLSTDAKGQDAQSTLRCIPLSTPRNLITKTMRQCLVNKRRAKRNLARIGSIIPTRGPTRIPTLRPTMASTPGPTATPLPTSTPLPTATSTPVPAPTTTAIPTSTPTVAPTRTPVPLITPPTQISQVPIPSFDLWRSNMLSWGKIHCDNLKDSSKSDETKLASVYYDAQWVFLNIFEYTDDIQWKECANLARRVYRDSYVRANGGRILAYWNFSTGMMHDYLSYGDQTSKETIQLMATNAAFAPDSTPLSTLSGWELSRETAYLIVTYLNAEKVGYPRRARLAGLVNNALGHIDQWFVSKTAPFIRPFMVSLTAYALTRYHEATGDPRVVPALKLAADELWRSMWLPTAEAFKYTNIDHSTGGQEPAPDLNLLAAPFYAWLYRQTGETKYQVEGDAIFSGGVRKGWLSNGKQFNQSYRWSFDFVKWRTQPPLK